MLPYRRVLAATIGLLASGLLLGQQRVPQIAYVYPAGGQRGSVVEVIVGGQSLEGTRGVWFSGEGMEAEVTGYTRPLTGAEAQKLREELNQLMEKRRQARQQNQPEAWTPQAQQRAEAIRRELAERFLRKPSSPAIAEVVSLRIKIPAQMPLGKYELRLRTPAGLTNPLAFFVDEFPEVTREPVKLLPGVDEAAERYRRVPVLPFSVSPPVVDVQLPVILNGQILPGAIHRYRFPARKGQRLVAIARARELVPYIPDAVPGWFEAVLTLRDEHGREIAAADHYRFSPDPVLLFEVPSDGTYQLEIRDSIYRGRQDFVYRVAVGELPVITAAFPLGGRVGRTTSVQLVGWHLTTPKMPVRPTRSGIQEIAAPGWWLPWGNLRFLGSELPQVVERKSHAGRVVAQRVKLPVLIHGRIGRPGEWDRFEFRGRAGDQVAIEVVARQLGSPIDSVVKVENARGELLAVSDDIAEEPSGLLTHPADSFLLLRLPQTGIYRVSIGDAQGHAGEEYAYCLRISAPQPDFDLRVAPASLNLRPGEAVPVLVHALRKDGFNGEIRLALADPALGFELGGGVIPPGESSVRVTVQAPRGIAPGLVPLRLEGVATIQGRQVRRLAVPASDMMQAFFYHHLVPASAWIAEVLPGRFALSWELLTRAPVRLSPGGRVAIEFALSPRRVPAQLGNLRVMLNDPPQGVAVEQVELQGGHVRIVLSADPKTARPGLRGNLILQALVERARQGPAAGQRRLQQVPVGFLPAVPFELVPAT